MVVAARRAGRRPCPPACAQTSWSSHSRLGARVVLVRAAEVAAAQRARVQRHARPCPGRDRVGTRSRLLALVLRLWLVSVAHTSPGPCWAPCRATGSRGAGTGCRGGRALAALRHPPRAPGRSAGSGLLFAYVHLIVLLGLVVVDCSVAARTRGRVLTRMVTVLSGFTSQITSTSLRPFLHVRVAVGAPGRTSAAGGSTRRPLPRRRSIGFSVGWPDSRFAMNSSVISFGVLEEVHQPHLAAVGLLDPLAELRAHLEREHQEHRVAVLRAPALGALDHLAPARDLADDLELRRPRRCRRRCGSPSASGA